VSERGGWQPPHDVNRLPFRRQAPAAAARWRSAEAERLAEAVRGFLRSRTTGNIERMAQALAAYDRSSRGEG
jgi:hypothetical protein